MSTILPPPHRPYPFATKSQEVIPHEVAIVAGCFILTIAAEGHGVINELPPELPVLAISSEAPVLGVFDVSGTPPTLPEGELIGGGIFCPPGTSVVAVPDVRRLWLFNRSDEEAVVYVQLFHSWNILGTAEQLTRW